ncbi:zeta toxin family protein [Streptomyces sp. NPDC048331]|uniref:zeta toxin family protein n=1 Tax=Streptomyces sp. NPDC048331 TaxID=3365534 RepID=UPI00371C3345
MWVFDELIVPSYLRRITAQANPAVVYLVGEHGAGHLLAWRMLRRAMRPGAVRLDPENPRASHPDYLELMATTPRTAGEAVCTDAQEWQAEAEAYVRERRGDLVIESDYASAADFLASAGRFARAGYRVEVVVLADREADSRQNTFVRHARALELDVVTELPLAAAHARACRAAGDITVAAASAPDIAAVTVLDADRHLVLTRIAHPGLYLPINFYVSVDTM